MFELALAGHTFWVIERDGSLSLKPVRQSHLFVPPGARATVVVEASDTPGRYPLRSLNVDTGPQGDPNPNVLIGSFIVGGKPVGGGAAILARLRKGPVDKAKIQPNLHVAFSETANGDTFFITNRTYDEDRVDRFSGTPDQTLGLGIRDVINIPYARTASPAWPSPSSPSPTRSWSASSSTTATSSGMMANISVLPKKTLGEDLWDGMTRFAGLELPSPWPLAQARESGQAFQTETSANICRPNSEEAPTTH